MSKFYTKITSRLQKFIEAQKIFFIATAPNSGRINLSPKGMDSFRVINENRVLWLNVTGSGNETATHIQESNRMTIMFCSFEGKPLILRLYGKAKGYHSRDPQFQEYIKYFSETAGARQIFELDIDLVQASCGFAVPFMDYVEERTQLRESSLKKGTEGLKAYWKEKNSISLDGHQTHI